MADDLPLKSEATGPAPSRAEAVVGAWVTQLCVAHPGLRPAAATLQRALDRATQAHAGQQRASGRPYIEHPQAVAELVALVLQDPEAIVSALLHDTIEDTTVTVAQLHAEFGPVVARIVEALTKIEHLPAVAPDARVAEDWRRLIFGIADDPRVVIVKLADRLHNMRTLDVLSDARRQRIAQETRMVYAPLADRFGLQQWKAELEDAAFKYLEPEAYQQLKYALGLRLAARDALLREAMAEVLQHLREHQVAVVEVEARAKHLWSIQRKLRVRHLGAEGVSELHDLHGLRVLLADTGQCYQALGVMHNRWQPVPGRFKDYIASPKSNGYQSLHTTLIGPRGTPIELQLRTLEQHRVAEWGLAAHWAYKDGSPTTTSIEWFAHLKELASDNARPEEFLEYLQLALAESDLFALTPAGEVKRLPVGASVLDFAFAVHSDVGSHAAGARVNGRQVPLSTVLRTGDRVEIQTHPRSHPTREWLSWVRLPRARQKIRQALAAQQPPAPAKPAPVPRVAPPPRQPAVLPTAAPAPAVAADTSGLMVKLASCCRPVPGDAVRGFITRGRGITIHRDTCPDLSRQPLDRQLPVTWPQLGLREGTARLWLAGTDRKGLALDLMHAVTTHDATMSGVQITVRGHEARARLDVAVEDCAQLARVIAALRQVRGISDATREEPLAPPPSPI